MDDPFPLSNNKYVPFCYSKSCTKIFSSCKYYAQRVIQRLFCSKYHRCSALSFVRQIQYSFSIHCNRLRESNARANLLERGERSLPEFKLIPLQEEHARLLCEWRYKPPYNIYNWRPWEWMLSRQEEFADTVIREEQYCAVVDEEEALCGFAQLFPIVGVTRIGLGMRPDLCGQGRGVAFITAIVEEARLRKPGNEIDLEVLAWNERAIRVYERAGFHVTDTYERMTPRGMALTHCMVWDEVKVLQCQPAVSYR